MRSPIQSIPASIHPATLASFMVLPGLQYLFFVSYNLTPYPIMAKLNSLVSKSAGLSLFLSPGLPQSSFFQGACPWFRFAGQMFLDCPGSYSCSAGYWLDSHYHHIYPSYTLPCNWLVGHYLHKPLIAWLPVSTTPSNSRFPHSTKIITKIHCRAYFHRKLDYRKQDIIEDCMQDQHCWRCFIFIHLENIVLRSFVDVQGVFYRTQVSLGSGLWVPVSLFKYIHTRALVETLLMWLWLMMIPTQYDFDFDFVWLDNGQSCPILLPKWLIQK